MRCIEQKRRRGQWRSKLGSVFCPNCMSPYVEVVPPDPDGEGAEPPPDEVLVRCTECEYAAPRSEFVPENYR
jgi:hypothetical protein